MSTVHRTIATITALIVSLATLFAAGTFAAFAARPVPDDGSDTLPVQAPAPAQITVTHGSPIWVFVLVALVAAAVSAAVILAALRLRRSSQLRVSHA